GQRHHCQYPTQRPAIHEHLLSSDVTGRPLASIPPREAHGNRRPRDCDALCQPIQLRKWPVISAWSNLVSQMALHGRAELQAKLDAVDVAGPERTGRLVDLILADAVRCSASDIHVEPTHSAVEVRYRLDGVLQPVASLRRDLAPNLVARLKVLAELLTYRLDLPPEGRIAHSQ